MYKVAYTEKFKKAFNNLSKREQDQDENLIILIDIGHHDILKKL